MAIVNAVATQASIEHDVMDSQARTIRLRDPSRMQEAFVRLISMERQLELFRVHSIKRRVPVGGLVGLGGWIHIGG